MTLYNNEPIETHDASSASGVYANADKAAATAMSLTTFSGDSADEVDPRKLVRDPTLSEIRWYYRRTFAKTIVDKPIDDAFKNGFEFTHDESENARKTIDRLDAEYKIKLAEKKARRDGFSLIFLGTQERGTEGLYETATEESVDVDEVTHLKVMTVDDLTNAGAPHEQIQEGTGLSRDDYDIRDTGIVMNTDIGSRDYRTPAGYVMRQNGGGQFIHADRVLHLTWNEEVDGNYNDSGSVQRYSTGTVSGYWGLYEGDSVLIPSYDLLKGMSKGNWSIMQALFRNAAHLYTIELPEDADNEDQENADAAFRNMSAKSEIVHPSGYEVQQHESGNEMEPSDHFDVIFSQICAAHEMTRSVLFGTQTGTVSGSEVDIKNYFNKVERYRNERAAGILTDLLTHVKRMEDSRTNPDYEYDLEVEWGPLFKVDDETRLTMLQNATNALSTAIGQYILTPDEARGILDADFTEIDVDDMTEKQMDELDRIRLATSGQGGPAIRSEREYTNAPGAQSTAAASQGGTEGGREQGQRQSQQNPASASDAAESLSRLAELHEDGHLTDEEFEAAKADVID